MKHARFTTLLCVSQVALVVGCAPSGGDDEKAVRPDVQAVVAQPETRERLQATGAELFEDDQAGFRRFFLADIEKWRGVVKAANLKLE